MTTPRPPGHGSGARACRFLRKRPSPQPPSPYPARCNAKTAAQPSDKYACTPTRSPRHGTACPPAHALSVHTPGDRARAAPWLPLCLYAHLTALSPACIATHRHAHLRHWSPVRMPACPPVNLLTLPVHCTLIYSPLTPMPRWPVRSLSATFASYSQSARPHAHPPDCPPARTHTHPPARTLTHPPARTHARSLVRSLACPLTHQSACPAASTLVRPCTCRPTDPSFQCAYACAYAHFHTSAPVCCRNLLARPYRSCLLS